MIPDVPHSADRTESDPDARTNMLKQLTGQLYELIEANEPFFPEEFAEDLVMIRELAVHWSEQARDEKTKKPDWLLIEGMKHLTRINEAYEALKQRIRDRLRNVAYI